ncbi:hypothetical protein CK203_072054 [Vitis vinifera]|uniref:Uncharacterized protein n=1 Tax=Vitis vinifera TaxID=29760 RepID=A0A438EXF3_VITVI|nr:hypothetical protein CK203_072054 [Vitis vinifera]
MDTASESYQKMLHESIQRFFAEYEKGVTDFSAFSSIFFRLMQAADPPLETVWFYSALNFHSSKFTIQDPILVYRELFHLIVTCSALCNSGLKRIALLAPVIYELYRLVSEKRGFWLNSDVEFLVEGIVSYLSICCCKNSDPEVGSVHLGPGFLDVVRVWTVGRLEGNRTFGDDLSVFFPLVSDEVCQGVGVGCGVGYLAGIVMSEAFIMRLCLKFGSGASRAELEKDMRSLAVEMISGFRNCYFFDTLLRMLLEPVLPVTSLLMIKIMLFLYHFLMVSGFSCFIMSRKVHVADPKQLGEILMRVVFPAILSVNGLLLGHDLEFGRVSSYLIPNLKFVSWQSAEDEVLLRKVLYDAVIMEKYTFLNPQIGIQLFGNQLKNIVVTWLFVADNAILYVRENGDQAKAISYINAFSESQLPSQLIKWVATQSGMGEEMGRPKFSTPIAFMKWLLIAEDQGIRVFDHNISKLHAKAMMYKSRVEYELPVCKLDGKTRDNNVFFYTDNEGSGEEKIDGDQEMIDSLNAAMLAAACTVNLTTDGRRKRKGIIDEGKTQFKFGKYHLLENSFGDNHLPFGDDGGSSSGSEVENPVSDEDMEIMEQ